MRTILPAVIAAFAAAGISSAQDLVFTSDVDTAIESILADWNSPAGVGVAVVQRREDGSWNIETKGYGVATINGSRVDADTLFSIGSNSKLFTVLATGLLISNDSSGDLTWDTKIASLLPQWGLNDAYATSESTIVDLMSHRTGLPRHDFMYRRSDNITTALDRVKYLRPSAPFRSVFQYTNTMYVALASLTEALQGVPLARYVKQHIFDPLGLKTTTYSGLLATGTGKLADGIGREVTVANNSDDVLTRGTPRAIPFWDLSGEDGEFISGAGGIISSANEAATLLQMLLLEGSHPATGETVVPAAVVQKAATGVTVVQPVAGSPYFSPTVYGGGQVRGTYRGNEYIEHDGGTPGFLSAITRFPYQNLGIAVFSNDDQFGSSISQAIKFRIADAALQLDPIDWNSQFKAQTLLASQAVLNATVPRPGNASLPSASLPSLAGIYRNQGYGDLEFCLVPYQNTTAVTVTDTCEQLLADVDVALPDFINPAIPTLVTKVDSIWATHIVLQHFDGDEFRAFALDSQPTGDPARPYWIRGFLATLTFVKAEFVSDGDGIGLGISGGIWGAGRGVEAPQGDTPRERAEVWFDQV